MEPRRPRMFMACPHCDSAAKVRSSYTLTPMIRESIMVCSNEVCGHTFVVVSSVDRTVSPSAMPRAGVTLRLSTQAEVLKEQARQKAQAVPAPAANTEQQQAAS